MDREDRTAGPARVAEPDGGGAVPGMDTSVGHPRTRQAVVRLLLTEGPLTVPQLAQRLGLTTAAVRRHLDQLVAEGAVDHRDASNRAPRGRGRPARAYLLTGAGHADAPQGYDALALAALRFVGDTAGPQALATLARQRALAVVEPIREKLAQARDVAEKIDLVAGALTDGGFAASIRQVGIGVQLCQHHCPVASVASHLPVLCEEEFAVLSEALGTNAQRLATIARGDSFCTTFIPLTAPATAAPGQSAPPSHRPPRKRSTV